MIDRSTTQHFEAILYPNQPVSPRTFVLLMGGVSLVVSTMSLIFISMGAWPISGFLGLDVVLLFVAFRWAQREARRHQRVTLDDEGLHIEAVDGSGNSRSWRLEPYWARVEIDRPPSRTSLVVVSSHGNHLRLGQFLTPEDRLDFADALIEALARFRSGTR
ncbi:MAG: DUF2244 domain-containing protein [Geminicoccaceae bacterium]|nr:DUF2244 domain-containing protein [Geminicoccaceae bacterium]